MRSILSRPAKKGAGDVVTDSVSDSGASSRSVSDRPSASRRAFLCGRAARPSVPRPFGAIEAMAFEEACNSCGDCARVCPEGIILRDGEGFPVVDVREGECTFCGDCIEACQTGALVEGTPWGWVAGLSAESCLSVNAISCRTCEDQCEAGALRFRLQTGGRAIPEIDTEACTGCGACASSCPNGALGLVPASQSLPASEQMETRPC